jgi:signal peptidase I
VTLEPGGGEADAAVAEGVGVAPSARRPARERVWRAVWELLHDLSIAVLFCFFLITFVAQAFRVQGTSMEPLLRDGDRIVVNKFVYRFQPIETGDVVVFWYPRDPSVSFIKRVVGRPGDVVEIRAGRVFVNGTWMPEAYLAEGFHDKDSHPPITVQPGHYFVLGDHRRSSNDSRSWGEVPQKYIYGQAVFRFWPLSHMGPIR